MNPRTRTTPPVPRKFSQVRIICQDNQTKEETTSFDPRLLSAADLNQAYKTLEGYKMEIAMELARRAGINKKPEGLWVPPKAGYHKAVGKSTQSKNTNVILDETELKELMNEL